jgi:hypothetical protein
MTSSSIGIPSGRLATPITSRTAIFSMPKTSRNRSETASATKILRNQNVHYRILSWQYCMEINAICEFGMRDEDVTRITRRAANAQRHTLMDTLRRAQMEGELDAQTDIESLDDFFEGTLAGIRIASKAGKSASMKASTVSREKKISISAET